MAFITVNLFSQSLKRTVDINVILPSDKVVNFSEKTSSRSPRFKTLYLLHGYLGDRNDWVLNTPLRLLAEAHNLAVVMPSGDNNFYVDSPLPGNDYERFITQELLALTRAMFPLSHRREDTFIAGLSMGGYGAIRNGLKHYRTFGAIGGFSSALQIYETEESCRGAQLMCIPDPAKAFRSDWNPTVCFQRMAKRIAPSEFPKIYMACATEDGLFDSNVHFRDMLRAHGAEVTWHELPGGHNWDFWRVEIERFIEWLPLDEAQAGISSGNVKK